MLLNNSTRNRLGKPCRAASFLSTMAAKHDREPSLTRGWSRTLPRSPVFARRVQEEASSPAYNLIISFLAI